MINLPESLYQGTVSDDVTNGHVAYDVAFHDYPCDSWLFNERVDAGIEVLKAAEEIINREVFRKIAAELMLLA